MKKIFFYTLLVVAIIPNFSFAQNPPEYKLIEPLPCIEGTGNKCDDGAVRKINLNTYIEYVFKFSIALAAALAVMMIIWGGFQIMFSETPFKIGDGKQKIWNAIIGLVMVLASYLILQTIDPRLVNIDTRIKNIEVDTSGLGSFRNQLVSDLDKQVAEKLSSVIDIENEKVDLEKQLAELETKKQNGQITLGEYEKQKAQITQTLSKKTVEQNKLITEGVGASQYKKAINYIYDPAASGNASLFEKYYGANNDVFNGLIAKPIENKLVNNQLPTDSPNTIQNEYNKRINQIIKTDPKTAEILGKQRDFYIQQIQEDVKLRKEIGEAGTQTSTGSVNPGSYFNNSSNVYINTSTIEKEKTIYTQELQNSEKYKEIGISKEQYEEILNNRIKAIDQRIKEVKK